MKKKLILTALCGLVLMAACTGINVNLSGDKKIEPSKTIKKEEYRQKAFDKVEIDAVANVKIIQGRPDDFRVILSAPENYVELFSFSVVDGELNVEFKNKDVNIDGADVDVTIYTPTLRELENSGLSNVEIDQLTTDQLEIDNAGVGKLYLKGLKVQRLDVECSGVGGIELSGEAGVAELDCSGVGSIDAENLKAQEVRADVSGVGGIRCWASKRIVGEVSGVGSLKYGGHPAEHELHASGVGKISEL